MNCSAISHISKYAHALQQIRLITFQHNRWLAFRPNKAFSIFLSACLVLVIPFIATHACSAEEKISVSAEQKSVEADLNTYRIGSGDILEIVTWKEPDFTKDVLVRHDGKITFPLLDDIQAAGRTPVQVKNEIETGLKEYIESPIVTVTVKGPESRKFYILGEVAQTGEYPLIKELTVLQAFALAGGFTEWASKKEIVLLRREAGAEKIVRVNYKNIIKGKDLSQNVIIKVNDTIIVP